MLLIARYAKLASTATRKESLKLILAAILVLMDLSVIRALNLIGLLCNQERQDLFAQLEASVQRVLKLNVRLELINLT